MPIAMRLRGVGKRYRKYDDNPTVVSGTLRWRRRTRRSELWAVRHVDLEVPLGACYGVIGRNGSGKSTTLQLLAGVTAPTEGRVEVRGMVAPLISVGVGFHPELTGRENIYINGVILGLSRRQIDAALDEIIEFSEIAPFIDSPVKFYSSGMSVRLGFSVAIQALPDVLLLDEVLAVGDIAFQMKCFDRISQLLGSGITVLLVTHNMNAVRQLCSDTLVLHAGEPRFFGASADAFAVYQQLLADEVPAARETRDATGVAPAIRDVARIVDVHVTQRHGDGVVVTAVADVVQAWPSSSIAIGITTSAGLPVYYEPSPDLGPLERGRWAYSVTLTTPLPSGDYEAVVVLRSLQPLGRFDVAAPVAFSVAGRPTVSGVADLRADFRVHMARS